MQASQIMRGKPVSSTPSSSLPVPALLEFLSSFYLMMNCDVEANAD